MSTSVVIIDPDSRHAYLMVRQLRDSHGDLECVIFSSTEEFLGRCGVLSTKKTPSPEELSPNGVLGSLPEQEAGDISTAKWLPQQPISMFIISIETIQSHNISEFAQGLLRETAQKRLWKSDDSPPKIMLLDYEGEAKPISSFQSPMISDLVYKPVDWQLFSQKIDIALGLSKGKSTHIYAQDTEFHIKIARERVVEQISDFGFVMRSQESVPQGSFGYFYFPRDLDPGRKGFTARCLLNRPHPELPGMMQTYFSFFGLSEVMSHTVRDFIIKGKRMGVHFDSSFDKVLTDYQARLEAQPRNFIIIEMNPKYRETIRSLLIENFQDVNVFECSSYQDFLRDYLDVGKKPKPMLDLTTPLCSIGGDQLKITVGVSELSIEAFSHETTADNLIFGYEASKFLADKKFWLNLMGADDRQRIHELLAYALTGQATEIVVTIQLANEKQKAIRIRDLGFVGKLRRSSEIKLELTDVTKDKIREELSASEHKVSHFDGIFIAGEFVGKESSAWLDALRKKLLLKGMVARKSRLPFFVFLNEDIDRTPEDYKDYGFDEFIFRPIDRSQLLKRIRLHFPFLKMKPNVHILLEFMNRQFPAFLARDAVLEQIAEYGIKIRSEKAHGEGAYFTLFHPLFVDEHDNVMHIRSYYDRDHPKQKGYFETYFSFFGVRDSFLKKIRRWIREYYASKAAKQEN